MLNRWVEGGLLDMLADEGIGCIAFSPLAQGMLTDKYLHGIPRGFARRQGRLLAGRLLSEENLAHIRGARCHRRRRGQSLAQMALAWGCARTARVTSVLIGASRVEQIEDCVGALENPPSRRGAGRDRPPCMDTGIDLWARSRGA